MRRLMIGIVPAVVTLNLGLWSARAAPPADETPVPLHTGAAQLFVDDVLIGSQVDLRRTLHQPRKDDGGKQPLLAAKQGTGLLAYGSIVYDARLKQYVMFIQEYAGRGVYRVTSPDGLTWSPRTHDELPRVEFDLDLGPLPPNVRGRFGIDLFSCYYDVKDPRHPYKGWLYFANCGNDLEGIFFVRSPDGVKWERVRQVVNGYAGPGDPSCRVIHQDGKTVYGPGDVTLFYHDPIEDRFLGIFKFFNPQGDRHGNSLRSRAYLFLDSLDEPVDTQRIDRVALLPPAAEQDGDTPFDEYYASTAWRYESLWLGGLKVFHGRGDYPHSAAGCAFLKLVVSRDGLHWKKVPFVNDAGVPEVFIPNGPEGGNDGRNDGGYISEFSQGPLRVGDELIYYYSASSYGKNAGPDKRLLGGGIFRARLRIDGFVSVDGGTLTTRPLAFQGEHLTVNGAGPIRVGVQDRAGNVRASTSVTGDSLNHAVKFEGRSLRQVVPEGLARLSFTVDPPGKLYSFTIR